MDKPRKKSVRVKTAKKLKGTLQDASVKTKFMGSFAASIDKSVEGYEERSEEIVDRAFDIVMLTYFENKTVE